MTYKPYGDGTAFGPDQMPLFHGHIPPGESVKQLTPDCCTQPDCAQRDWNRAVLLTLEKFSQAYAALLLTRDASSSLWHCDEDGHTENCPDPECVFGRLLDEKLSINQKDFGIYMRAFCSILARMACDLTPQWQDFTDTEQFYVGLKAAEARDTEGGDSMAAEYLLALRDAAVLGDPIEFQRWFRPPPEGEAS